MESVSFTIPGRIGGKARPRFIRKTGHTYTPEKTKSQEAVVRDFASQAMNGNALLEGPLHLSVSVLIQQPASWSKKRKSATRYVTGKPDPDNQIKLIADAANGILWRDDSQIAKVNFMRLYTEDSESVTITVRRLDVSEPARTA